MDSKSVGSKIKIKTPSNFYKMKTHKLSLNPKEEKELAKKAFNELLLEAIDEAFASLGESAKQSIYYHLKDKFKIAKNEIPNHLKEFAEGLEKIFGAGAQFLEILIMKELYARLGTPLEWDESKELVFVDYVKAARQCFLRVKARR